MPAAPRPFSTYCKPRKAFGDKFFISEKPPATAKVEIKEPHAVRKPEITAGQKAVFQEIADHPTFAILREIGNGNNSVHMPVHGIVKSIEAAAAGTINPIDICVSLEAQSRLRGVLTEMVNNREMGIRRGQQVDPTNSIENCARLKGAIDGLTLLFQKLERTKSPQEGKNR